MNPEIIYDFIGIGIGPFNLGLAALTNNINELNGIFIDKNKSFNWHPGLMLPTAKMQVPFYADLVTLADPTSPFTYMNYLKQTGKLFRFAINESYFPYRIEYNAYCQWVVTQLNNLYFGYECKTISYDKKQQIYYVTLLEKHSAKIKILTTKKLIIGIGSSPCIPACAKQIIHPNIFHASEYLDRKNIALMKKRITIIGSGQSAAEIFQDLLPHINDLESLNWYTRSARIHAMDYSKFALEMSSPEYIAYFYQLPKHRKADRLASQHDLYKGINLELIESIYEELYRLSLNNNNRLPKIRTNTELLTIKQKQTNEWVLAFRQNETGKLFTDHTDTVILATGYKQAYTYFLDNIKQQINWTAENTFEVNEDYSIDNNHSIFVQNAEWETHGFNSADLGLGPYRNCKIINSLLKKEYASILTASTFQRFACN
jgi:lysine N6-hydroxylase